MGYEKKYNEALERAKELLLGNEHSNTIRSYFEHIFPELREDERIRKELIFFLKKEIPQCSIKEHADKLKAFVSYLEKQKEPKQTDLPAGFYFIDLDGKKYYSKEFRYGDMKLKVGEQKPAWSEEDERILKGIIGKIDHDQTYGVSKAEMLSFLKDNRPSWKPSDHQMNILKAVKEYVGRGSGYWGEGLGSLIEDLEKLM